MTNTEKKTFLLLPGQIKQIEQALEQAEINGSHMETTGLCEDLCRMKHQYLTMCVSSLSSGTIAGIIGDSRYTQIEKAVNKTLEYLNRIYDESEPELVYIGIDCVSITNLISECYQGNRQ
jgi:hypothetical protein